MSEPLGAKNCMELFEVTGNARVLPAERANWWNWVRSTSSGRGW